MTIVCLDVEGLDLKEAQRKALECGCDGFARADVDLQLQYEACDCIQHSRCQQVWM